MTKKAKAGQPELLECRLAAALKLLLDQQNVPQKTVAKELGIPFASMSRFMRGETLLSAQSMMRLGDWMIQPNRPIEVQS